MTDRPLPRRFPQHKLEAYLAEGCDEVVGWLTPVDREITRLLGQHQSRLGIGGNIAEIGVFHGKLFILLLLMLHEGERALAIDPFTGTTYRDQPPQTDEKKIRSTKWLFQQNLKKHAGDDESVTLLMTGSDSLGIAEVKKTVGPVRLFSVDGNHDADYVRHDLELAAACLAQGGVVLADDVFNRCYPGVSNGLHQFLAQQPGLIPFCIGQNKVFLCASADADMYRTAIRESASLSLWGRMTYFGVEVEVVDAELPA